MTDRERRLSPAFHGVACCSAWRPGPGALALGAGGLTPAASAATFVKGADISWMPLETPPVRRLFNGNTLTSTAVHVNNKGVDLPAVIRALGRSANVPVIDLTARSKVLVESLGPSASQRLYLTAATDGVTDNTHFSVHGATEM